jgi:cysteine dioxygenase
MRGRRQLLDMFQHWDQLEGPIPMAELLAAVEGVAISRDDLAEALGFDDDCYRRAVIHASPHYQALVLCWRSEQRSPIHDHCGSNCVVRVVEGRAIETRFGPTGCGRLVPLWSHEHLEGAVAVSCGEEIHQMGNFEPPGHDLITFHVYSPPPSRWRFYQVDETTLVDHDRLIRKPARTVRVELGHDLPSQPMGTKTKGGLPCRP